MILFYYLKIPNIINNKTKYKIYITNKKYSLPKNILYYLLSSKKNKKNNLITFNKIIFTIVSLKKTAIGKYKK